MRYALEAQRRNCRGGILVLIVCLLAFVVVPAGIFATQCGLLVETKSRSQNAMGAAALLTAENVSRVVVNDPHFGFISLSNQPPIGRATLAADGQPCPIQSINNLIATVRLDTIIAHESNSEGMCALADEDYENMKKTTRLLQSALDSSVASNKTKCLDMNGEQIRIYEDAQHVLESNLRTKRNNGGSALISNLHVTLGWLKQGGTTNTPLPEPVSSAHLMPDSNQGSHYRSCTEIPAFGKSFVFAATADRAALVDTDMFALPDGHHICSVVKVEADIANTNILNSDLANQKWIHVSACAVPCDCAQAGPTGALMVFFPCGQVDQLGCLDDLLNSSGPNDRPSRFYLAEGGDLPCDAAAHSGPASLPPWSEQEITCSRTIACGLYCWLRCAGVRPRIDSTLMAFHAAFSPCIKSSNLLYEFAPDGNVEISSLTSMPLPISVLSDRQLFLETRSDHYTVTCYNNVFNLGIENGGKQAGQSLAGNPINWCDLAYFGFNADSARHIGKGPATGLVPIASRQEDTSIPGAISSDLAVFETKSGALPAQPRSSYYSGGLAVELSVTPF